MLQGVIISAVAVKQTSRPWHVYTLAAGSARKGRGFRAVKTWLNRRVLLSPNRKCKQAHNYIVVQRMKPQHASGAEASDSPQSVKRPRAWQRLSWGIVAWQSPPLVSMVRNERCFVLHNKHMCDQTLKALLLQGPA